MSPMLQQFLAVSLPICLTFIGTIWVATFMQNKRLDDIISRLGRIETKLEAHGEKIAMLDERTSPLASPGVRL